MRIHLHPPDGAHNEETSLSAGDVVLVGREPDSQALPGAPAPTRTLQIAQPRVSANHLLLWRTADGTHARDLSSKNGTFVRLEPGTVASLSGGDEAHFFLSAPRPGAPAAALRDLALIDGDAEAFSRRLRDAVSEWLAHAGVAPAVSVGSIGHIIGAAPHASATDDARFSIPLVDGLSLDIEDQDAGRTEVRWDGLKGELYPYVFEQVSRWRACHGAPSRGTLAFQSPGAAEALRAVLGSARLRVPLVLRGESGTGKSALAAIYARRESIRPGHGGAMAGGEGGPAFVTVHCAHLDPPLAHATLFGALKGSYTSAERTQIGAVKLADGGVLFLDDVDALPLETQAKLLRFLDEGRFEPLGHGQRESLVSNVRVVASTNVDLRVSVRERRFREDLYWRLHIGAVVCVPPLRERRSDVEALFRDAPGDSAASEAATGAERRPRAGGRSVLDRLEPAALEYLVGTHPWRGNFRECLRFCTRVRMEPSSVPMLDRRRCEQILAEASLEPETPALRPVVEEGETAFERALRQAVRWWQESEGGPPESFEAMGRFCEVYLKSNFVAHVLDLTDAAERPESFDRERRQRLGCDLTTLKRKIDEYVQLRRGRAGPPPQPATLSRSREAGRVGPGE